MMMPPEEHEPTRVSTKIKMKYVTKYVILIVVGFVAVFVIPAVYWPRSDHKEEIQLQEVLSVSNANSPWYTAKGKRLPAAPRNHAISLIKVWPENNSSLDRIEDQLMLLPIENSSLTKTIVIFNELPEIQLTYGEDLFSVCPVSMCSLSNNLSNPEVADALLFTDEQIELPYHENQRSPEQVWILYMTKSPYHTGKLEHLAGLINWTATYRTDSDIVVPQAKWVSLNGPTGVSRNYASGKTKTVVWFVKDCKHDHNGRMQYVRELKKHIRVDIFGQCEHHNCPCNDFENCFEFLSQYKFYLAFENLNCRDYISKNFFMSMQQHLLSVVMGARPEDYEKVVPPRSYIHVDDFYSPRHLARYLLLLDEYDDLYNSYFLWKTSGELVDPRFFCRLCALLHSRMPHKSYSDLDQWWMGEGTCTEGSWWDSKNKTTQSPLNSTIN